MKKVLKKIGKCIAVFLATVIGILAVLCVITLIWGGVQCSRGDVYNLLPSVPQDFTPTIRLVVMTDSHHKYDRCADAIDTAYDLFDTAKPYAGVDAFLDLGDFSSIGEKDAYVEYAGVLREHVRPETPMIVIHGNHEFKQADDYPAYYDETFGATFGTERNSVTEINGFSLIAFSGDRGLTEWTFTPSSLKWYSNAIKEAEKTADGKAIFTFQHPHPWGTVYGSTVWGDPEINCVLNGHTNVVNFSGHSHFPLNDPRSINQATYTAVGCGAMASFELDNNGIVGQHPERYDTAAEFCVVEADNDGSVRIRGYDLNSDTFFCDYYIDNVNDRDSFPYTVKNMKAHDSAPVFGPDTAATAVRDENGEWVVSFDEPQVGEGYIVHEYKIRIKDEAGKTVSNKNLINDYYFIDGDGKAQFHYGADVLEAGKTYTMTIRAESAYHFHSEPIELTFTAAE